jgi:glycosyltransferase involved in cell wall biosynthesis
MRVLHASSGNLYGGVETALVTLARLRHLCPSMQPEFALSFEGRLSRELTETGVVVHQLGEVRARKPWTVWAARRQLRQLLSSEPFDAVVCHMSWPMAVFGRAVKDSNTRLAFWAHDAIHGRTWLERWAAGVVPDLIIGNSLFTQGTIVQLFPDTPCSVIYYPVLLRQQEAACKIREEVRKELGALNDTVAIIQVSRMEAWKGHLLHLEALSRLKHDKRWVCWMVGGAQRPVEQEYMRSIEQRAIDLGIGDRVLFLGQRSDVPRLLAAADIFSQPNMGPEPFGIVFIEALSAGLPVVTTSMGGPKEIINASCGMVVPPEHPEFLAASLQQLIDSPALRSKLGQNGPERARELCDPAKRIPDLYEVLSG